jgi:hypothetical protein
MAKIKYRLLVKEHVLNEYIIEADSWDEAIKKLYEGDTNEPRLVDFLKIEDVLECDLI